MLAIKFFGLKGTLHQDPLTGECTWTDIERTSDIAIHYEKIMDTSPSTLKAAILSSFTISEHDFDRRFTIEYNGETGRIYDRDRASKPIYAYEVCKDVILCDHCGKITQEECCITFKSSGQKYTYCTENCAAWTGRLKCIDCGRWVTRSRNRASSTRKQVRVDDTVQGYVCVCDKCYKVNKWVTCDMCDGVHKGGVVRNSQHVCDQCARHMYECPECHTYYHERKLLRNVSVRGQSDIPYICSSCFNQKYYTCSNCGANCNRRRDESVMINSRMWCPQCVANHGTHIDIKNRIRNHNFKPRAIFSWWDRNNKEIISGEVQPHIPFMGVELEVEVPDKIKITDACDLLDPYEWLYIKRDGTIKRGFEIVTHPQSMSAWHLRMPDIEAFCKEFNDRGISGFTQGLHVHISKNLMSYLHKGRFQTFFDANAKKVAMIATRDSERFARYKPVSKKKWSTIFDQFNGEKYMAVNWLPVPTVEIRVFRGTTDPATIMSYVEFVYAVYKFTEKNMTSIASLAYNESWPAFLEFISTGSEFRYIRKYIKNMEAKSCVLSS